MAKRKKQRNHKKVKPKKKKVPWREPITLHPSHWQAHLEMEERIARKEKAKKRRERLATIGDHLGVYAVESKKNEWAIYDWWTDEILLTFNILKGIYRKQCGESGMIKSKKLLHAMEFASGSTIDGYLLEQELAATAGIIVDRSDFASTWRCIEKSSNQLLLHFQRTQQGYRVVFPQFLKGENLTFEEVANRAQSRLTVSQVGVKITLKELGSGDIVTYQITDDEELDDSGSPLHVRWHCPLGKQIIYRRLGDRFQVNLPRAIINLEVIGLEFDS